MPRLCKLNDRIQPELRAQSTGDYTNKDLFCLSKMTSQKILVKEYLTSHYFCEEGEEVLLFSGG